MNGAVRKVDKLGRVVLPIQMRKKLDLKESDELSVLLNDDCIIIKKQSQFCKICGKSQIDIAEFSICRTCFERVKRF